MRVYYAVICIVLQFLLVSCETNKPNQIESEYVVVTTNIPGSLCEKMSGNEWANIKKLSISGPLNEDDFLFLKALDNNGLTHLDLSKADVKKIDLYFCDNKFEELTLPNNVESIEAEAFQSCINLKSINLSSKNKRYKIIDDILYTKNVDTIVVFPAKCGKESFTIPKTVKVLCSCPFLCSSLKNIEVEEGNENFLSDNGVLYTINKEILLAYPSAKEEQSFTIPSQTNATNWSALWYANNLKEIKTDKNNSIYLSRDGVLVSTDSEYKEEIGQGDLSEKTICAYPAGKPGTTYIVPDDIKNIDICAFRGSKIEKLVLGSATSGIEKRAFHESNISQIEVQKGNEYLQVKDDIIFYEGNAYVCPPLKKGEINIDALSIQDLCFQRCNEITTANINTDENIGAFAFSYCKKLKKVTIGNKVKGLDFGSFFACTSLESIELPKDLNRIESKALCGDINLRNITCQAQTPPIVGSNAFLGIDKNNCILYVPHNAIEIYKNSPEWSKFTNICPIE